MNFFNFSFSESAEWTAIATAVGTLLLAAAAIFGGRIYHWYYQPKLKIAYVHSPPDSHKIPLRLTFLYGQKPEREAWGYYFRLKIFNEGRGPAHQVEVFADKLLKKNAESGVFEVVTDFIPMNLRWSHFEGWFASAILPNMYRHCNLAQTTEPRQYPERLGRNNLILFLTLQVIPNNGGEQLPTGVYRLGLKVAAANLKNPVTGTLEISNSGTWFDKEDEMFENGISIRKI